MMEIESTEICGYKYFISKHPVRVYLVKLSFANFVPANLTLQIAFKSIDICRSFVQVFLTDAAVNTLTP